MGHDMNIMELFTPQKKTWLYKVNPAVKFALLFILFIIVFFNQNYAFVFYQLIATAAIVFIFSGYSLRRLLLFSLPILLTLVTSTFTMILFGRGETVWWQWGIIKISEESFYQGLLLGFKSACFGFISLIFLLTSRPMMMFYAFMQQFKLPAKYAYSFIAAFRMVPMIIDEFQIRTNALKVRGVQFSKGFKGIYERMRLYTIPLFAQSIRRAQRLGVAMEAKRFHMSVKRTYYYPTSYSWWDILFSLFLISIVIVTYVLA